MKAIPVELGVEPKAFDVLTKSSSIDLNPQAKEWWVYSRYLGGVEVGDYGLPRKCKFLIRMM